MTIQATIVLFLISMAGNIYQFKKKKKGRDLDSIKKELEPSLLEIIIKDQNEKKEKRIGQFEAFVSDIEVGMTAEHLVKKALNI